MNKVGDNQVLLQSIKGSPYYNSFGDRATVWETKLTDLDEILNCLNAAQRKWVYLEPYQEQMKLKSPSQTGVSIFLYKRRVEIAHSTYECDGALRCAMVRYGALWCAMVRYGALWCAMVLYGAR